MARIGGCCFRENSFRESIILRASNTPYQLMHSSSQPPRGVLGSVHCLSVSRFLFLCEPRREREIRCRANMGHKRQSRPDYGLGFQTSPSIFYGVPSSLNSGMQEMQTFPITGEPFLIFRIWQRKSLHNVVSLALLKQLCSQRFQKVLRLKIFSHQITPGRGGRGQSWQGAWRPALQAEKERHKRFQGLLPESQGQNLAVTVLHVPYWGGGSLHCPAHDLDRDSVCVCVSVCV